MNKIVQLSPDFGPVFAAVIAVIGWFIGNRLALSRERKIKRHDMITKYLLEAYRRLENAANRDEKTEQQAVDFESAIADIQLLGSKHQINTTIKYLRLHSSEAGGDICDLLSLIRDDLRKELKLYPIQCKPIVFRFTRRLGSGDWQGNPVSQTEAISSLSGL